MTQRYIRSAAGWGPRIWAKIYYPQMLTLLMCLVYLRLLIGWTSGLIDQPRSFEGGWGELTMYMVGALIVIGCIAGIPSALAGEYRVEFWAVIAVAAGVAMYSLSLHLLNLEGTGNRLPSAETNGAMSILLMMRLWWVVKRPMHVRDGRLASARNSPKSDL